MQTGALGRGSRTRWLVASALLALLSAASFVVLTSLSEIRPGNPYGLSYGIAAAALLGLTGVYALRRRAQRVASRWKLGAASWWLNLHLFAGVLFVVLVLLHSGLQLPEGILTWCLWSLSLWTALSGLLGLALQRWLPRSLATLSTEVLYDRIPELAEEMRERAEAIVEASREPLPRLFEQRLAKTFSTPRRRLLFFFDVTGGIRSRLEELDYVRRFLEPEEQERLDELRALYRTKMELDAHFTLQHALRFWLYAHVPFSLLLAVLVVVHVYLVISY